MEREGREGRWVTGKRQRNTKSNRRGTSRRKLFTEEEIGRAVSFEIQLFTSSIYYD